jgi:hypothetical protein
MGSEYFLKFKADFFRPEVFMKYIGKKVSVKTQPSDIRNNIILHTKGYTLHTILLTHTRPALNKIML